MIERLAPRIRDEPLRPAAIRDLPTGVPDGILGNHLLRGLAPADFALLAPHLVVASFPAGRVLQEPGQSIVRVYFPSAGAVSLLGVLPDGSAAAVAGVGREGAIGLPAGLGPRPALARALVQAPLRAACTSAPRLAAVAAESAGVREMIVGYGERLMAQVQQTALCGTLHQLQARLCSWLLQARDRTGSDTLGITQQALSTILGAQRTSITTISCLLQAEGAIDVRRGQIRLRDIDALERRACSCYRVIRGLIGDGPPRPSPHADYPA